MKSARRNHDDRTRRELPDHWAEECFLQPPASVLKYQVIARPRAAVASQPAQCEPAHLQLAYGQGADDVQPGASARDGDDVQYPVNVDELDKAPVAKFGGELVEAERFPVLR